MILWEFPTQGFWDYCHMCHSRLSKLGHNLVLVYPSVTRTWNIAPELPRTVFLWDAILGEVEVNTSSCLLARFFLWDDSVASSKKQLWAWTLRKRCQILKKFLNCRKQGIVYLVKRSHCWKPFILYLQLNGRGTARDYKWGSGNTISSTTLEIGRFLRNGNGVREQRPHCPSLGLTLGQPCCLCVPKLFPLIPRAVPETCSLPASQHRAVGVNIPISP